MTPTIASALAPVRTWPRSPDRQALWLSFGAAALVAVLLTIGDSWLSNLFSPRIWQRLHLAASPFRAIFLVLPLLLFATVALHALRRVGRMNAILIVLMSVAMQTNGVRPLGFDLITVLPFVVIALVIGRALLEPWRPIHLTSVTFFGMALLVLAFPYVADSNVYSPARFFINYISFVKGIVVAFAMILIIDDRQDFRLAIRAMLGMSLVTAAIGVGQILLEKFAHVAFSLVAEEHETKPTFFGTLLRASGLTSWAQWLADLELIALPFLMFAVVEAKGWRARFGATAALLLVLTSVFFTFTYAAYAGVALMLLVFPFVAWPRRSPLYLLAALLFIAVFQLFGGWRWVDDRLLPLFLSSPGMVERKSYLLATIEHLIRDPWLGAGVYADEEFSGNFYRKRAHNTGLQAWAYLGLGGFLVFLATMLVTQSQVWLMALARHGGVRRLFLALGVLQLAVILTMFAQPNFTVPATWYLLGLTSAALRVFSQPSAQDREWSPW